MPTPNFQQLASNSLPRLDTASCRRMPLSTDNINERGTKPLRVAVQRELAYQGDTSRPDQTVTPLGTASLAASDNTYYVVRLLGCKVVRGCREPCLINNRKGLPATSVRFAPLRSNAIAQGPLVGGENWRVSDGRRNAQRIRTNCGSRKKQRFHHDCGLRPGKEIPLSFVTCKLLQEQ